MKYTIFPFMTKELNLSGADLLIYAFLYSNAREYIWKGYRHLGRELNLNVHTVITSIGRLEDKNLIMKLEKGYCVTFNTVGNNVSNLTQNDECAKIDTKLKLHRKEKT